LNATTNASVASVALLRDAATAERAGARAAERIAQVHALLGDDMAVVDRELTRLTRDGLSPATDSAAHLLEAGGKRVRPLTVLLSAACFGPVPAAARDLAVVAEMIHLATLLHDDVVDDGHERRGRTTPRRIWGNAVSVLAGDLLLTHALERTAAAAPGGVLADLFATLRRLVDGEVVQLRGRARLDVREEVYFRIVHDKTASLFAWAARAGAAAAGAPAEAVSALGEFGARVGVAFQLVDDVLDYDGDPRATGKALLGDLLEASSRCPSYARSTPGPSSPQIWTPSARATVAPPCAWPRPCARPAPATAYGRSPARRPRAPWRLWRRSRRASRGTCWLRSPASCRRAPRRCVVL
jgi:octaprenyl-diphosphate synthase